MALFDWLTRRKRQEGPAPEWWEEVRRLQHDMEQLQLSWEETYGKVRRALATLAKRQQREEEPTASEARFQKFGNGPHPTYGERLRAAREKYGRSS